MNDQVKVFVSKCSRLSPDQSGFLYMHTTISAVTFVVNDIAASTGNNIVLLFLLTCQIPSIQSIDRCLFRNYVLSGVIQLPVDGSINISREELTL